MARKHTKDGAGRRKTVGEWRFLRAMDGRTVFFAYICRKNSKGHTSEKAGFRSAAEAVWPRAMARQRRPTGTSAPSKKSFMANIFKIKREERWLALVSLLVLLALHALMWEYFPASFFKGGKLGFWSVFYNRMCLSGFDNYSYIFISSTRIYYEMVRHPLFAAVLFPLYWANEGLRLLTSYNCAVFLMSGLTIFCAVYSLIFLYRILRHRVGVGHGDALLLTALFFSFAMIMLTMLVPDHFCLSLLLLLLTLWLATSPARQPLWLVALLTTLTGGITLSNVAKSWLATLLVRGRAMLRPAAVVAAVVVPLAIFVGAGVWQNEAIIKPLNVRGERIMKKKLAKDSTLKARLAAHDSEMRARRGKPIADNPLLSQTNMSAPRGRSLVENFFGEGIQLHQRNLLQDYSVDRPAFVPYNHWWQYAVEAVVVLLFLVGAVCGTRSRVMLIGLGWWFCDLLLHVGLGFGLNEVYIMSAHWMFVMPLGIAFLLRRAAPRLRGAVRGVVALLTVYLLTYNGWLLVDYLLK